MLSSFFVQNFRSILELKLDFSYGEWKAPNGYQEQEIMPFIEAGNKQRLVPCAAFFGANASGKSNLLKALGALKQLINQGGKLTDYGIDHNPIFLVRLAETGQFKSFDANDCRGVENLTLGVKRPAKPPGGQATKF